MKFTEHKNGDVSLRLTRKEAGNLADIMGINVTIPEYISTKGPRTDKQKKQARVFLNSIFDWLYDRKISRNSAEWYN